MPNLRLSEAKHVLSDIIFPRINFIPLQDMSKLELKQIKPQKCLHFDRILHLAKLQELHSSVFCFEKNFSKRKNYASKSNK